MTTAPMLSPSFAASTGPEAAAFELKFLLEPERASKVAAWADRNLSLDPHGDPALDGDYLIHGLYLDTPTFDVFHRTPGHRRRKFRLRRYGDEPLVHLERKIKMGERVRKRRTSIDADGLNALVLPAVDPSWSAEWFHRRIRLRDLRPALHMSYRRRAFIGTTPLGEPLRLTLDRGLYCEPASGWEVRPAAGRPLSPDRVILELKYRDVLPTPFHQLLDELRLCPRAWSKYREGVSLWRPTS